MGLLKKQNENKANLASIKDEAEAELGNSIYSWTIQFQESLAIHLQVYSPLQTYQTLYCIIIITNN